MEIWKTIEGFENYEVSNLGNVKSLSYNKTKKERLMSLSLSMGYYKANFYKENKYKTMRIHVLVAVCFLNHKPEKNVVVDHIDGNKKNNNVNNLQIITHRENISRGKKNKTSKYTGVSLVKNSKKWKSSIDKLGKKIYLGCFDKEEDARDAYLKAL